MILRDRVLDEARAVAMGNHHAAVEPRHVLWGLVRALGADAPPDAPLARVKLLMAPPGTAHAKPPTTPEADAILAAVTDVASARAVARDLATRLLAGVPEFSEVAVQAGSAAASGTAGTIAAAAETTASVLRGA